MTNAFDRKFLIGTLYEIAKDIQALEAWSEWNGGIKEHEIAEFKDIFTNLEQQLFNVADHLKE